MTFKKRALLLIFTLLSFIISGQTLTGVVTYINNVPLVGENDFNDSGKGVITDINGSFTLALVQGGTKINFSYIGFETLSQQYYLDANELKNVKIVLNELSKTKNKIQVIYLLGQDNEILFENVKEYLKSIGAKNIIKSSDLDKDARPLDKGLYDGAVDTVGGLSRIHI